MGILSTCLIFSMIYPLISLADSPPAMISNGLGRGWVKSLCYFRGTLPGWGFIFPGKIKSKGGYESLSDHEGLHRLVVKFSPVHFPSKKVR